MSHGDSALICQAEGEHGRQLLSFAYKFNQWGTAPKSIMQFLHNANWERGASTLTEQLEEKKRLHTAILESLGKVKV